MSTIVGTDGDTLGGGGIVGPAGSTGATGATGPTGPSGNVPAEGTALANADATINPASSGASQFTLPASVPLTSNRVLTLGTTGSPITNSVVSIVKRGAGAFTYTVKDDAATSLFVFASGSTNQQANFYFDGTHYKFLSLLYLAS